MIKLSIFLSHANKEIKNNQGKSPMDLMREIKDYEEKPDEKVNKYVKDYLLKQYKKEHEDLLVHPYTPYSRLKGSTMTMKWELYFTIKSD